MTELKMKSGSVEFRRRKFKIINEDEDKIDIWMNGQNGSHHCFPLLAYWKRARVINRGSKDRNDCIRELMGNEPIDAWIKDIAKAIFFDPMQYEESNDWFKRISIIDFPPAFE